MASSIDFTKTNHEYYRETRNLYDIRLDNDIQPRVALDWRHVRLLKQQLEEGKVLDPVDVFYDGTNFWLADGFHRWYAHRDFGKRQIECHIHIGSRRQAMLFAVGSNANHQPALPRSQEDKRRAVLMLLNDSEWCLWSDREISRRCNVSQPFVSKLRDIYSDHKLTERLYKTRHGNISQMQISNIGRKRRTAEGQQNKKRQKKSQADHAAVSCQKEILLQPSCENDQKPQTDDICSAVIKQADQLSEDQVASLIRAIAVKCSTSFCKALIHASGDLTPEELNLIHQTIVNLVDENAPL